MFIGIITLASGIFISFSTKKFLESAVSADGVVIDMLYTRDSDGDSMYTPVVAFITLQGEEVIFKDSFSSNPPKYSINENVKVLYLPETPNKAKLAGFLWFDSIILLIFGSVFTGVGTIIGLIIYKKHKTRIWAKKHGTPIKVKIQSVEKNITVPYNAEHPYQIHAQWLNPNTSEIHVFKSANIWFKPQEYIKQEYVTISHRCS